MNNRTTNTTQTQLQDDPQLDRAWSDISDELPPMAADSAILSKAREEVSATRRRVGFLPASWMLPIGAALAAGLVLGVSLGTFKQQAGSSDEIALAPSSSSSSSSLPQESGIQSSGDRTMATRSRQSLVIADAVSQKEEALEDVLVKPLERSIPRAPAADVAIAPAPSAGLSLTGSASSASAPTTLRTGKVFTEDATVGSNSSGSLKIVHESLQSASSFAVVAPQAARSDKKKASDNSKEAISDTLSEMLDEISDASGELDDAELDQLFATEESWLISIQRLLTNRNDTRALQLADEFRQRFPDAIIPEKLQSLFNEL